jgi:hypothetical protein
MRASETAIREIPITQREPPERGLVSGQTVAKDEAHIAVATAANSFVVVEASGLGRDVQIGERLSLRFNQGRASMQDGRGRGR